MIIKNPEEFLNEHALEMIEIENRLISELRLDEIPGGCKFVILPLTDGIAVLLVFGSDEVYDAFTSFINEEGELVQFVDGEIYPFDVKSKDDLDMTFTVEVVRNTKRIHNSVALTTEYLKLENDNGTVIDDPIEVIDDTAHICGIAIQAMLNTDA